MTPLEPWVGPALIAVAYLAGSFSLGLVLARRAGVDLRSVGSGNIGATNVERALGKRAGLAVLAADLAKGALPVVLARALGAEEPIVAATGLAAVMGHVWPLYHGLRGGKGAATAGGALLASVPLAGLAALVTYFVGRRLSGLSSVGSLAGAAVGAAVAAALADGWWLRGMAALLVLLVAVRHRDNIARLLRGEERPVAEATGGAPGAAENAGGELTDPGERRSDDHSEGAAAEAPRGGREVEAASTDEDGDGSRVAPQAVDDEPAR